MSGRRYRASLLMPSFVVIATASACGASRLDDDPPYNPPNPNPNPTPSCPTVAPSNGGACESEGLDCEYGANICDSSYQRVRCSGGTWQRSAVSCNPPPPVTCPAAPQQGPCSKAGLSCNYFVPDCGAVNVTCGTDYYWSTTTSCTPRCPSLPPTADSSCLGELSCVYGDCDEAPHVTVTTCSGGVWTHLEAACPPEGGGGAGGEGGASAGAGGETSMEGGTGGNG